MMSAQNDAEAAPIESALRRIRYGTLALAAAGTAAFLWLKGWAWGFGFLTGALGSALNFRWLEQFTAALASGGRQPKRFAVFFGLRYLVLGAGGYAMAVLLSLSGLSIVVGLLTAVAAVLVEMTYELARGGG